MSVPRVKWKSLYISINSWWLVTEEGLRSSRFPKKNIIIFGSRKKERNNKIRKKSEMRRTMRERSECFQLNFGLIIAGRKTDIWFQCDVQVKPNFVSGRSVCKVDLPFARNTVKLLVGIESNGMGFSGCRRERERESARKTAFWQNCGGKKHLNITFSAGHNIAFNAFAQYMRLCAFRWLLERKLLRIVELLYAVRKKNDMFAKMRRRYSKMKLKRKKERRAKWEKKNSKTVE